MYKMHYFFLIFKTSYNTNAQYHYSFSPHQWHSDNALVMFKPQPGRTCRPNSSEFSVVFFETCVNSYDSSERLPWRALPLQAQVSHADNCH